MIHTYTKYILTVTSFASILVCSMSADTVTPDDWYGYYSSDRMTDITDGNTGSPTVNYNSGNTNRQSTGALWSYFDDISMDDGVTVTFTTDITINYSNATPEAGDTADFGVTRFGLYQSNPSASATTTNMGIDRVVSTMPDVSPELSIINNWEGAMIQSHDGQAYRMTGGDYLYYTTTADAYSGYISSLGGVNIGFISDVAVNLTYSMTRSGDDLTIVGSYGGNVFSGTYEDYYVGGYGETLDAFGFWTSNTEDNDIDINSVTFSNTSINVIPEASILSYLAVIGFAFIGMRLRRAPRQ
ncbi:hypothetical protein QEH59_10205 [Coraliomargarita sp. SDUM461004]|uniref:PEP-CTERM protein-sorting domain-containing protein n=1 Tax=Thalassobacterium sedimentorum TaxID=3041258 RepID=A0ABU1AJ01_9BACT|nr:hypothetical protein [Coraliomargarita sp. SDUM461004]MDQ8194799.1 hypothetical protein [Coraliomargarita sp. SDUM461004]